ncbi:uncharacterized protein TRAVEDRAFT_53125 [Trametes versicolor FP-101664 SS1]|uniref:uncharacterized protein n=1 Tax=Trametes versicolor (strain FP-101664) TaxID=717944 RepID=UPI0004622C1D|nr:uncharacterized protein TRAVEDRAFT_53125 [Trametes versicolor FP-101664 SS1]EIW52681.1 hypothetical protein TRAVEDRAFT_53125 [Trametes versicolor FP-101664 SS1]
MAPANIRIQQVTSPSDDLLKAAAQIYVDTLQGDPTLVGATAGHLEHAPEIILAVLTPIARVCGELYAATDADGALVGFSAWVPPGRSTFDTEEQAEMGLTQFLQGRLDAEAHGPYMKTVNEDMPKFIDGALGIPSAEKASYWCWFAAVKPEHQRQGVFRAMLEVVTEKATAQRAVMGFLTSNTTNTALAERAGFTNKGHTKVSAPWGEWEFWCLAKDTRLA